MKFKIRKEICKNVFLYIQQLLNDKWENIIPTTRSIFHIMFLSEASYLVIYSLPLTGDTYLNQKQGPTPSYTKFIFDEETSLMYNKPELEHIPQSAQMCIQDIVNLYVDNKEHQFLELSIDVIEKSDWVIDYIDMAKSQGADAPTIKNIIQNMLNDNLTLT